MDPNSIRSLQSREHELATAEGCCCALSKHYMMPHARQFMTYYETTALDKGGFMLVGCVEFEPWGGGSKTPLASAFDRVCSAAGFVTRGAMPRSKSCMTSRRHSPSWSCRSIGTRSPGIPKHGHHRSQCDA